MKQKSRELYKAVHNLYERAVRKQSARREELAQSEKADTLRLYGELLRPTSGPSRKATARPPCKTTIPGEGCDHPP